METFSQRLCEAIEMSGCSRPEFAARAGVGTSALAKWLSGKLMPKSEQLYSLAKVGEVSMEWLLTGQEPKKPILTVWKNGFLLVVTLSEGIRVRFEFLPPEDPLSIPLKEQRTFYDAYRKASDDSKLAMLSVGGEWSKFFTHRLLAALEVVMKRHLEKS